MKSKPNNTAGGRTDGSAGPPASETFCTTAQVAARWHLHEETVRRLLRANRVASLVIGRRRLIPMSAILAFEANATIA